jgi:hypothetical protein
MFSHIDYDASTLLKPAFKGLFGFGLYTNSPSARLPVTDEDGNELDYNSGRFETSGRLLAKIELINIT